MPRRVTLKEGVTFFSAFTVANILVDSLWRIYNLLVTRMKNWVWRMMSSGFHFTPFSPLWIHHGIHDHRDGEEEEEGRGMRKGKGRGGREGRWWKGNLVDCGKFPALQHIYRFHTPSNGRSPLLYSLYSLNSCVYVVLFNPFAIRNAIILCRYFVLKHCPKDGNSSEIMKNAYF